MAIQGGPAARRHAFVLCWMALVAVVAAAPQFNPMVVMFGYPDWKIGFNTGDPTASKCMQQVKRAADRFGPPRSSIKFVAYSFYSWKIPDNAAAGEDQHKRHSLTQWLVRDGSYNQVPPTQEHVASYTADFATCLKYAISLGFKELYVNPMIDPDYSQQPCCPYRNTVELDPRRLYMGSNNGTWSYETLVLLPAVRAIRAAIGTDRTIQIKYSYLAENGRTFVTSAAQWAALTPVIKSTLGLQRSSRIKVGAMFNWNNLCGAWCESYSASTSITAAQWAAFRDLMYNGLDMFGISNYPQVWQTYDARTKTLDHGAAVRSFDSELQRFASAPGAPISIRLLVKAKKVFLLNEHGLGGCKDFGCDGTNTPDIYGLSQNPYNGRGSFGDGTVSRDVFRHAWTKAFRMEWYRQYLRWFRTGCGGHGCSAAYLWTVGSWDIAALYHSNSLGEDPDKVGCDPKNSYCDPDLLTMIKAYNKMAVVPSVPFINLPGSSYYVQP